MEIFRRFLILGQNHVTWQHHYPYSCLYVRKRLFMHFIVAIYNGNVVLQWVNLKIVLEQMESHILANKAFIKAIHTAKQEQPI